MYDECHMYQCPPIIARTKRAKRASSEITHLTLTVSLTSWHYCYPSPVVNSCCNLGVSLRPKAASFLPGNQSKSTSIKAAADRVVLSFLLSLPACVTHRPQHSLKGQSTKSILSVCSETAQRSWGGRRRRRQGRRRGRRRRGGSELA